MTDRPIDRAMSEQLRLMRELMKKPAQTFGWPILKGPK